MKCFDNQSIWMVHRMEPNLETVNDYLVSVFNDILTIEESELKKSQFNDLSITEMHTI
ncbi:MarR family transcriptional regulator, partial [Lactobacillus mulieris]|nr:MarR family transcriptional regulator [Lactobacillus mulieris]